MDEYESMDELDKEELCRLLEEKEERVEELENLVKRVKADFENYKKRMDSRVEKEVFKAEVDFVKDLLDVVDSFKAALDVEDVSDDGFYEGVENTYNLLIDSLKDRGLSEVESETFDPNLHQAIERVESDEHQDGEVVEVLQEGYTYHEQVLRPGLVRVAFNPNGDESSLDSSEETEIEGDDCDE
ncbi:nucleotide exchange factor GrpE [Methanonatronarchaeum sp. AMET-Sl]|uniref:nucleotide exchange factor GrpE n=1 Tax=Methanonatronarchaeum sp. AMET-Sl TaxID=3037654 RepID=UPI00244E22EE|nr:nucleotide exchange factor GrpE [Methanonatronarchaeum sp. AMET-Sl]WGI16755.1 nucleotide exchange factor GrpE [Methanonatronarchaeum sp. AMET-Sl]